jgi:V8-like Glu-specific endopeptidase
MKFLCTLFVFLFSFVSNATIFNGDDRIDFHEMSKDKQAVAQASIGLIHKYKLKKIGDKYLVSYTSLEETLGFCPDAKFSKQPQGTNCSGALIKGNAILTAAHCVSREMDGYNKKDFYVIFNYKKYHKNQKEYYIPEGDVYTLGKELFYEFDHKYTGSTLDLAIFKLNRKVTYKPAELEFKRPEVGDKVYVLGYPLGVPLKLSNDSLITKSNIRENSFQHELDTFSVNSGSPIFNSRNKIIGVHVRGTGQNFQKHGRECYEWGQGVSGKDFGEANEILALRKVYESLK